MEYTQPEINPSTNRIEYHWKDFELLVNSERFDDDGNTELWFYHSNGNGNHLLNVSKGNLLSTSYITQLIRRLKDNSPDTPWSQILTFITSNTMQTVRRGEEVIMLDSEIGSNRPEFLLFPLFIKGAPNIIYADRSSGKSLFLTLIDIILTLPWTDNKLGLNIEPTNNHNVLFLDWENDSNITGWQKECLIRGNPDIGWCDLPYLKCNKPLYTSVNHILDKITEVKADVVIIDSLGMAVGDDLNITRPAFQFYNALRQLPVTPIIIAHTSKDMLNKRKTVYGNAYYENEARSVWEISKQQEPGTNELSLTLYHRKAAPFTGMHEPIAFRFIFEGNSTTVESTEPDNDKRSGGADDMPSENDVALQILMESEKPLRPKDITSMAKGKIKATNIGTVLKRLKKHGIQKTNDGFYYYDENCNKLL